MEKYIKARRAKNFVAAVSAFRIDSEPYERMMALFDKIPAADVAPVIHEHWIKVQFADSKALINDGNLCLTDGFLCGSCGHSAYEKSPYCPHCGAKMDVETP